MHITSPSEQMLIKKIMIQCCLGEVYIFIYTYTHIYYYNYFKTKSKALCIKRMGEKCQNAYRRCFSVIGSWVFPTFAFLFIFFNVKNR